MATLVKGNITGSRSKRVSGCLRRLACRAGSPSSHKWVPFVKDPPSCTPVALCTFFLFMSDFNDNVPFKPYCLFRKYTEQINASVIHVPLPFNNSSALSENGPFIVTSMSSIKHVCLSHCTDSCGLRPHADQPFVCLLLFIVGASAAQHFCSVAASNPFPGRYG